MTSTTNRCAWLHIAAFLDAMPHRPLSDHARRVAAIGAQRPEGTRASGEVSGREALPAAINFGGCVPPDTACCPDGNHGEITEAYQA